MIHLVGVSSALGPNRSRSCSRRKKLEEMASWQRGQPSQRLPPVQPVRRWSGFPVQGLGRQGLPAGDGSQSGRLRGARDFDSRLAGTRDHFNPFALRASEDFPVDVDRPT